MTIDISPTVIAAFEQSAATDEVGEFVEWWAHFASLIGPPPPHTIAVTVLEKARADALELGIEDNEDNRIFLQAVATKLMPDMGGEQFLLSADVIFLEAADGERIQEILKIAVLPQ